MSGHPATSSVQCPSCGASIPEADHDCPRCGRALSYLAEGAVISGRYEIRALLGKGGMGSVYEATDRELDESVAIKVLQTEGLAPDSEQRFRSELRLARRVQHPNICRVFDFGRHGPLLYIVMERIEGTTLSDLIRAGRKIRDPLAVLDGVALGLGAIHAAGIVHRDLKPSNISVGTNGAVKLMDFGVAKEVGTATGLTATGMLVGTPYYMSPEQARGDHVDHRTDVYALGVIVCELLGGFRPFVGDTPIQVIVGHLQSEPELSRLPPAAIPVVARALSKEPGSRYESASEMVGELRAVLSGRAHASALREPRDRAGVRGPESTVASLNATVLNTRRSSRFPLLIGVGASLLLLALIAAWATRQDPADTLSTATSPVPAPSAAGPLPGFLLIDARPWARVAQVSSPSGESLTLPSNFTPIRVTAAPQEYTVVLVGPDGVQQQTIQVSVAAGRGAEVVGRFDSLPAVSADKYIAGMNWK
jgi:serine/threonine protein kinase